MSAGTVAIGQARVRFEAELGEHDSFVWVISLGDHGGPVQADFRPIRTA